VAKLSVGYGGFAQKLAFAQNIENLPKLSNKIDWE
jgi:hypothetical protein